MASSPDTVSSMVGRSSSSARYFTVFGGSLSEAYAEEDLQGHDLAVKIGAPIVGLQRFGWRADPGGCRLAGWLRRHLSAQRPRVGSVPQISRSWVLCGRCGAVYSPAITDFVVMVRRHELHVRHRSGRRGDRDPRGRGRCDELRRRRDPRAPLGRRPFRGPDGESRRLDASRACGDLPQNNLAAPAIVVAAEDRRTARISPSTTVVPDGPGSRTRRKTSSAASSTTGLPRGAAGLGAEHHVRVRPARGASVGVVAQQPAVLAGALDIDALVKAARFVRLRRVQRPAA